MGNSLRRQAPMSEFKRITDEEIQKLFNSMNPVVGFRDCMRVGAQAQLASCKKEQEQERRAIGGFLEGDYLEVEEWDDFVNALLRGEQPEYVTNKLKRGTLPEGIKEDG
jgi:hypothetical protein